MLPLIGFLENAIIAYELRFATILPSSTKESAARSLEYLNLKTYRTCISEADCIGHPHRRQVELLRVREE
jgi:hypothetical protein